MEEQPLPNLHFLCIDAATITPDANPSKLFFINVLILFFNKKTKAAPKVVPKNGISIPIVAICIVFIFYF